MLRDLQIESERLFLTPVVNAYAQDIFKTFTSEVTRYMYPKPPKRVFDTLDFIASSRKKLEADEDFTAAILNKKSREFLGCCGLHKIHTPTPELGIWVKTSAHGHGYGKEAIYAMRDWADCNLDYEYLTYPVDKDNVPSRRIPESLKGVVGREYEKINQSGTLLNILEFWIYPD